jgi:hypothetical protein
VRGQSAAATALFLNATRKEINRPLLKSHSGVVASSLRFAPALDKLATYSSMA